MRCDLRSPNEPIAPGSSQFVSAVSLRLRLDWFNKLRWGAALGIMVLVFVAGVVLEADIEVRGLLLTGAVLLLLNTIYVIRSRRFPAVEITRELRLVKVQMVCDLVALTIMLNLSGGVENPLLFIYIIHVIIASLLFKGREIFQIAWLAIFLFTAEVFGEFFDLFPHHHLPTAGEMSHELPFILMTLGSFWLVILFSAYVGALIMKHNRSIKDELVVRQKVLLSEDRAKTDFFRYVTHEIKSPVNTAQSGVETALDLGGDSLAPSIRDVLGRAVSRLQQATRIVQDLADLTRGGVLKEENLAAVDLNKLITTAVDAQGEVAVRSGLKIDLALPDRPVVLTTVPPMVETVVANLVNNAFRYSHDGGRVWVRVVDLGKRVSLVVEDEGIGISEEDLDLIFEEFFRSTSARDKSNLGTGLGLPIVRKFVEELGGSIEVESKEGTGSLFTVTLPRRSRKKRK
ncbi:MAG: HAMP domain-containing sensor histidine kinase [Candidatus Krumholzibacteriota bacterium]